MMPATACSVTDLVFEYVDHHYADRISLRDVAAAIGDSACHLTTKFRQETGMPVTSWIIKQRIVAAQRLLSEENLNVAAACEAVGFSDLRYFTRQFIRYAGVTPGKFRATRTFGGSSPPA